MKTNSVSHFILSLVITTCAGLSSASAHASSLNLETAPLFVTTSVAPLTMLVMGRDHKLYYEAYNDASDLNGDGVVDVGYQGYHGLLTGVGGSLKNVDYYGYFNSYVCYDYNSSSGQFEPKSAKSAADITAKNKTCAGGAAGEWSGDFLNYVTTARIDAVRKVFYGGKRSTDSPTDTVLERTHIPQDAHAWGKEYASSTRDGYDIANYTNLTQPAAGTYHLFANVSLENTTSPNNCAGSSTCTYNSESASATPRLRVLNDTKHRVWEWLSKERPVAGQHCIDGLNGPTVECSSAASNWSLVPSSVFTSLTRSFYDFTGSGHPSNNTDFINAEAAYAIPAKLFGTDSPSQINGSGNPFGSDEHYLTIFDGTIQVSSSGAYEFAVDGDDAVEVTINDGVSDQVVGWYGGHGSSNSDSSLTSHSMSVSLNAGINYTIKFRMEEATGGDSYYLYWKQPIAASNIADYIVRTQVCTSVDRSVSHETNSCQLYPDGNYKPTGLLHEFGEDESMMFGLLSGSYENNLDGGVLRKAIGTFTDEIIANTGQFDTTTNGIISTLDKLKVKGFNDSSLSYSTNCGWITNGPVSSGKCDMWGNPVAEMLYESLRYFSGKAGPTTSFDIATSGNNDAALGLPLATWSDPYNATTGFDECAKPFQIVVSDINPSYDSDKVPGTHSSFGSTFTGDITGLNASDLADTITTGEGNIAGNAFFIGQSALNYDNAPSAKTVTSLGSIRGMAPEEPTKLGSYYAASMAYYGFVNDVNARVGDQNLQTFSVALASPLPTIEIDPDNNMVTTNSIILVPFAKSVGDSGGMWTSFQPTNQIVDFYVESLSTSSGSFLINFEDVEQGADHDMDAIVRYTYTVNGDGTVTIDVDSVYAAGGIDQHMGYVISGTNHDGVYLEVKDQGGRDYVASLDTPASIWAGDARGTDLLGLTASRTFTPNATGTSANFLKDPLWYAAKWGGFIEAANGNDKPDLTSEWDSDSDGDPDNYFLVTNALHLKDQMEDAFDEVLARSGAATTVAVSSGSIRTDTLLYRAKFNTNNWSGSVSAIDFSTGAIGAVNWELSDVLRAQLALSGGHNTNREIITMNDSGTGVPFRFPATYTTPTVSEMSAAQVSALLTGITTDQQSYGEDLVNYLRGADTEEKDVSGATRMFRSRGESTDRNVLGDIVNSDPLHVVAPNFFYPDAWPTTINGDSATSFENAASQKYSDYRALLKDRQSVLYVGANDGMLHAINAYKNVSGVTTDGGKEIFAYVPNKIVDKLPELAEENYTHQYYVDGKTAYADVFFNSGTKWHTALVGTLHAGGQGVYALDISDPKGVATASGYHNFDESNAANIALWEFTDADDIDLGFTYGRASIVRLANGKWGAIFGNGYDNTEADGQESTTGNSVIYIVDVETGALIKKFDTEIGMLDDPAGLGRPNGMSEPVVTDVDGDFIADYIYAGDLFGNMWKVDIRSVTAATWDFSFSQAGNPAPLYTAESAAGDMLPITQAPVIVSHPKYGYSGDNLVFFGTGKYIENSDNIASGQATQSFFGIWDDGTNTQTRASLLTQTISEYTATNFGNIVNRIVSKNKIYWDDTTDPNTGAAISKNGGWVIDLVNSAATPLNNKGERSISKAVFQNSRLIFTTYSPTDDPCKSGGEGWVMIVDAEDGSGPDYSSFDYNNDGVFDNDDMIDTDGDGLGDTASSGFRVDGGVNSSVVAIDDLNNGNTKVIYNKTSGDTSDPATVQSNPLMNKRLYWRELK